MWNWLKGKKEDTSKTARWCKTCEEYRILYPTQVVENKEKVVYKCVFCDKVVKI